VHGEKRGVPDRTADSEGKSQGGEGTGGGSLIGALTLGAVIAWALGAAAMPIGAWIWLRRGGRRRALALVALTGGLVAQAAWLYEVATDGLGVVLEPDAGLDGWGAWALGFAGVVALVSGLRAGWERAPSGLLEPDRVFEVAIGLFGVGVLLQQIARALA
jgi:hypothetical protein